MSGLYVDLVPQTAWYDNLRALLQTDEWDAVRRAVYRRVTEPWTARKAEPPPQTAGVRVPRSNGCTVAGGEMRCRR